MSFIHRLWFPDLNKISLIFPYYFHIVEFQDFANSPDIFLLSISLICQLEFFSFVCGIRRIPFSFSPRKIDYTILFYINFKIFFNEKLDSEVQLET